MPAGSREEKETFSQENPTSVSASAPSVHRCSVPLKQCVDPCALFGCQGMHHALGLWLCSDTRLLSAVARSLGQGHGRCDVQPGQNTPEPPARLCGAHIKLRSTHG